MRLTFLAACALLLAGPAFAQVPTPTTPGIGYDEVNDALRELRGDPQVVELQQDNSLTWYFANQGEDRVAIWTFVPFRHPAYPAAIKRTLLMRDGALVMETRTLCQGVLEACKGFLAATEADGVTFGQRFASQIIENAERLERQRKADESYQRHLRDNAASMFRGR
jgi:hypothetical protein